MKIETKFNPKDKVWTIIENKARHVELWSIKTDSNIDKTNIEYYVNKGTEKDYQCFIAQEKNCYKTKQELIDSL